MSREIPSMSEFLLVPMNVQAFVVGSPGDPIYDLAPVPRTEEDAAHWYVESKHSFSFRNKLPSLEAGIHLHWDLPAALMHSHHEESKEPASSNETEKKSDKKLEQHCVPNRWLVLRLRHAAGDSTISSKAWVVESDYVS